MRNGLAVRAISVALYVALSMQCLAPSGYMAGSLEDGWPVVLCPEGLPSGFVAHRHHDEPAEQSHDFSFSGHCVVSGVLDVFSAESCVLNYPSEHPIVGSFAPYQRSPGGHRSVKVHPARAPPRFL